MARREGRAIRGPVGRSWKGSLWIGVAASRRRGVGAGATVFARGTASGSGLRPSLRAVTSLGLSMRHSPGRRRSSQTVPMRMRRRLSTS